MPEPAIVLDGVSKRFRPPRRPPGLPEWLWRRTAGQEHVAFFDEDDEEEEEEEEEPLPVVDHDTWALREVSLEVPRGTALGVIGPPGSGKSALLRILSRVSLPTEGKAIVHGRVAPPTQVADSLMRGELTGRKNAYLVASFLGIPREVVDRHIDDIAELAELGGSMLDRKLREYSSSFKTRLGVATILNLEPDVVLADGTLVTGDPTFRDRCRRHLRAARKSGLTVVLATLDLDTVRGFCDRAILLEEGRIVEQGEASEVVKAYQDRLAQGRALIVFGGDGPDGDGHDRDAPVAPPAGEASGPPAPLEIHDRGQLWSSYVPPEAPAILPTGEVTLMLIDRLMEQRGREEAVRIVHEAERLACEAGDTQLRFRHLAEVTRTPEPEMRDVIRRLGVERGMDARRRVFNEHAAVVAGSCVSDGEWSWIDLRLELAVEDVSVEAVLRLVPDRGGQVRLVQPAPVTLHRFGPWRLRVRLPQGALPPGDYSAEALVKTVHREVSGTIWHPDLFHFGVAEAAPAAADGPFELLWEFDWAGQQGRD